MTKVIDNPKRHSLIESRSIDFIPEAERHGSLWSQFTLWLGANLQITAIVTGALAVVLGGDVFWSLIGLLLGQVLGGAVVLVAGFVGNAAGLFGAGDAKFAAAMAPVFVHADLRFVLGLIAACILGAFAAHRLARMVPAVRSATTDWESWTPTSAAGENASTPGSGSGRKRKINKTPSSTERLAQSHAEDVLSLSLELERMKQELENEQMAHDQTRSSLAEQKSKNKLLEGQVHKVLSDLETSREDHARKMDGAKDELKRAQTRVDAAEEDAQLALD